MGGGSPAGRFAALALTIVVLGVSGCLGGSDDSKSPSASATPEPTATGTPTPAPEATPLASAPSSSDDPDHGGLTFDLMSLNRVDDAVIAQIRLTNVADDDVFVGSNLLAGDWTGSPPGGYRDVSGFALADAASRRLYTALRDTDGDCACTLTDEIDPYLSPGDDFTVHAAFPAPPTSTEAVTLITPIGPPLPAVAITDGEPPALPRADEIPDLSTLTLAEPEVLPISSLADSLDRSRSVAENDREVEIRLSTDVLFALNSARLTARSRKVIRAAARDLEAAGATSVRLEGHADSSGNDAINDPLSRRRAQSVAAALRPLAGGDVNFTPRGFGSRRPVAPNDTPDGRRRNRRVSLIYARPPADREATETEEEPAPAGEPAAGKSVEVRGRQSTAGQTATVELESLEADGRLATLTYTVTNTGDDDANVSTLLSGSETDDRYRFSRRSITGPSLVDPVTRQRYFVAAVGVEGEQICLCTDTAGSRLFLDSPGPGDEVLVYASYVIDPATTSVTVELARRAEIGDVAIAR